MRERLTVTVITKNEENRIGKCLESVAFADEILVVDSGSTDRTVEIARQHGARVIQQAWLGYGRQKQLAVEQAKNDWVFCLDADEWASEKLTKSIIDELARPKFFAYEMPRCNKFMGRWLRHGDGYPDWSLRLFNRNNAHWSDDSVHERVISKVAVGRLTGDLMHASENGLVQYKEKQKCYVKIQATQYSGKNNGFLILRAGFSFLFRFVRLYIWKMGFLDGWPGFVHSYISAWAGFNKYYLAIRRSG